MLLKSREDIEVDLIIDCVKADFKDVHLYLDSIGWDGSLKDYVDVKFLSQQEPVASHFLLGGLILVSLIGFMILGVNITGNAINGPYNLGPGNVLIGLFLLLAGLFFIIMRFRK